MACYARYILILLVLCTLGCVKDPSRDNTIASNTRVYYTPPVLPFTFSFGSGGFDINFNASLVTPIGTFGVEHFNSLVKSTGIQSIRTGHISEEYYGGKYRSSEGNFNFVSSNSEVAMDDDDLLIVIKLKGGQYDYFKLSGGKTLDLYLRGSMKLSISSHYVLIDFERGKLKINERLSNQTASINSKEYLGGGTPIRHTPQYYYEPSTSAVNEFSATILSKREFKEQKKTIRTDPFLTKSEKKRRKRILRIKFKKSKDILRRLKRGK